MLRKRRDDGISKRRFHLTYGVYIYLAFWHFLFCFKWRIIVEWLILSPFATIHTTDRLRLSRSFGRCQLSMVAYSHVYPKGSRLRFDTFRTIIALHFFKQILGRKYH